MQPDKTLKFSIHGRPFLLGSLFIIFIFNFISWWLSYRGISLGDLVTNLFFLITTILIVSIFFSIYTLRKREIEDREFLISLIDTTYETLTRLHKEPSSTESYLFFLEKLEPLLGSLSSAIYVHDKSTNQMRLFVNTNTPNVTWPTVSPYNISTATDNEIHLIDDNSPLLNNVIVPINRGMDIQAQLIFKVSTELILTDKIKKTFKLYSRFITNILYITKLTETNLRNVQYLERSKIARELHDSIAQSLSYMKIQASRLQSMVSSSSFTDNDDALIIDNVLQDLRSTINVAYRHLRELMSSFRITMGGRKFSQALVASINEFSNRSIIAIAIDNRLPENTLAVPEETQLLLIIRECLSNIVRHSQASSAQISIIHSNSKITVCIEDNGIGFPKSYNRERHHGIIIMQERILALRGKIKLNERIGGGTTIVITLCTNNQDSE